MFCVYHNRDLDGFTSGAIVKYKYPDVKLIGYDYNLKFELNPNNEPVIMADISLKMEDMKKLAQDSRWQLTWIDHHISSIESYKEFIKDSESFCTAVLENGIAACEGTWKHLFNTPIPRSVKLLGEYDTWRCGDNEHWINEVLPFQYGMRLRCNSVETFPMEVLTNDMLVEQIIQDGKIILNYQIMQNKLLCEKSAFEAKFEGLNAICINSGLLSSTAFDSVYSEQKHDVMVAFQYLGDYWSVSLYTTKDNVDCSKLAIRFDGGGHRKAAGFRISDIKRIITK